MIRGSTSTWRRRWREWTFVTQVLIMFVLTLILAIVMVALSAIPLTPEGAAKTALPVAAALIALVGLTSSAIGVAFNVSRQRREATMKAYSEWSDSTWLIRKKLQQMLGDGVLSEAAAAELVGAPGAARTMPKKDRSELVNEIGSVLNGLERLAVGVELGVYDIVTLRRLAGTIVVRYWERFETYIKARRLSAVPTQRQKVAYLAFENVVGELRVLMAKEDKRALDVERLQVLENQVEELPDLERSSDSTDQGRSMAT